MIKKKTRINLRVKGKIVKCHIKDLKVINEEKNICLIRNNNKLLCN